MSEWSQRKAANNDGMDPDWRPDIGEPPKSDPLEKIKALIRACDSIAKTAKTVPIEENVSGRQTITWYNVSASSTVWNEFVRAYEEVMFK
jgi:hypothetical protein